MKKSLFPAFLLWLMLFSSCEENVIPPQHKLQYFDLTGFMTGEIARLNKQKAPIRKLVFLNGMTEEKQMDTTQWEAELSSFINADINKKSFLGKYAIDTFVNDAQKSIHYVALDNNLRTRWMEIHFNEDQSPALIKALQFSANTLYTTRQQLTYQPDSGFQISGSQNIRFLEPDSFFISVKFQ